MKKLIFLISLIFSLGVMAQGQVSTSIPTTPKPMDIKESDNDPKSVSTAATGAVQMENDGLRKYGADALRLYFGTSTSPVFRFYDTGIFELQNSGQLFGMGVNPSGQVEFMANGGTSFGTTSTAMTIDDGSGRFVGMGTFAPLSKLDVSGDLTLSKSGLGFGTKKLQFYSDQGTGNEWRPAYIETADGAGGNSYTGRLDFYTNGTGVANKLGTVLGMSILNGMVGIKSTNPTFPLDLNFNDGNTSSTTGSFKIGTLGSTHLTFDDQQINSWSNTSGTTFFINYWSGGKVQIGNGSATGSNLDVSGFTRLGSSSPNIKIKKIIGTTDADNSTSVSHALTKSKILSISVLINSTADESTGNYYTDHPNTVGSTDFRYYINSTDIVLQDVGSTLQGKPYKVLVTYEE